MSTQPEERRPHSADVQMHLRLNGRLFTVTHMAPGYVIVDDPVDYQPCEGELTLSVDGRLKRWMVLLSNGMSRSAQRVNISRRA